MNVGLATEKFVLWMRTQRLAKSTIGSYECQVRMFLYHFEQVEKCRLITSEQIMEYLNTKIEANTQRHAHGAIKMFYENVIGQPRKFRFIPLAQKPKKLPQILEASEIAAMLKVCKNTKHQTIVYLLYGCGFRVQELIDLQWSHIDRASNVIRVVGGKGKKDRRVQLYPKLIELLTKYFKEYRSDFADCNYILKGQFGGKYTQKSINSVLKQLAKKAGVRKRIHAHLLRHCYATHMLEAGTDLRTIQELLGHASPTTTAIYTHVSTRHVSQVPSPMSVIAV